MKAARVAGGVVVAAACVLAALVVVSPGEPTPLAIELVTADDAADRASPLTVDAEDEVRVAPPDTTRRMLHVTFGDVEPVGRRLPAGPPHLGGISRPRRTVPTEPTGPTTRRIAGVAVRADGETAAGVHVEWTSTDRRGRTGTDDAGRFALEVDAEAWVHLRATDDEACSRRVLSTPTTDAPLTLRLDLAVDDVNAAVARSRRSRQQPSTR